MKNKIRFLAMMLIGVLLSVNQVWGAIANPYSFTFAKGDLTTSQTSYTSGEVTWSLSATANQWDGTKMGYIFGSASTPKTLTISTDDISGTITNVSVTGRSNNSGKTATVSVKVGTTSFTTSDNSWDNGSHQTLQFSGSASGTIAVTITPNACGYGLLGISVTYSTASTYTVIYLDRKSGHFQPSLRTLSQIVIWGFFAFFCKKVFHIRCTKGAYRMHIGLLPPPQPLFSPFGTLFAQPPFFLIYNVSALFLLTMFPRFPRSLRALSVCVIVCVYLPRLIFIARLRAGRQSLLIVVSVVGCWKFTYEQTKHEQRINIIFLRLSAKSAGTI